MYAFRKHSFLFFKLLLHIQYSIPAIEKQPPSQTLQHAFLLRIRICQASGGCFLQVTKVQVQMMYCFQLHSRNLRCMPHGRCPSSFFRLVQDAQPAVLRSFHSDSDRKHPDLRSGSLHPNSRPRSVAVHLHNIHLLHTFLQIPLLFQNEYLPHPTIAARFISLRSSFCCYSSVLFFISFFDIFKATILLFSRIIHCRKETKYCIYSDCMLF